jgi:hypothetical protein
MMGWTHGGCENAYRIFQNHERRYLFGELINGRVILRL